MLPIQVVGEIERLLNERRLSRRAIARRLGVARGTVDAIARGRRGLFGREPTPHSQGETTQPPERCPGCGVLVTLPCVYCRAVDYASRRRDWVGCARGCAA